MDCSVKFQNLEETCRNDYDEMKARFNNMLGQVQHINGNYLSAITYYSLSAGKKLYHNDIALAQCFIHPNAQNYL